MSLRVNTNVAAMNAYRNLSATEGNVGKGLEKLSSGLRITAVGGTDVRFEAGTDLDDGRVAETSAACA